MKSSSRNYSPNTHQPPATYCVDKILKNKRNFGQFSKNEIPGPFPNYRNTSPCNDVCNTPLPPQCQYRQQGDRSGAIRYTPKQDYK